MYNKGLDVPATTKQILAVNKELQTDYEDQNSFWFALAKAQLECGALDKGIYEKVKSIIEGSHDLKLWEELNGTSGDLKKRE